jgi:hypothetical protein
MARLKKFRNAYLPRLEPIQGQKCNNEIDGELRSTDDHADQPVHNGEALAAHGKVDSRHLQYMYIVYVGV